MQTSGFKRTHCSSANRSGGLEEVASLEQAVHLMYFTAGNVQRRVMPSDRVFVRRLQEAVDLAVGDHSGINL